MGPRTTLEPGRHEWVLINLGIGCTPDSLISEMVRDGFEPDFADSYVKSFAKNPQDPPRPSENPRPTASEEVHSNFTPNWKDLYNTELVVGAMASVPASPVHQSPVHQNSVHQNQKTSTKLSSNSDSNATSNVIPRQQEVSSFPVGTESSRSAFVSEPSRIIGDSVIRTSDRQIRMISRLRRPEIIVLENVLSPEECDELKQLAAPKIRRSMTLECETGNILISKDRTSDGAYFQANESELVARIDRRIAELTATPLENGECLQIFRYGAGAEYRPHFDFFVPGNPAAEKQLANGGQRIATLIIYLNDVEAGGTTEFPHIGLSISPRKGNAVYFSYFNSLGQVDRATFHAGAPVQNGEKWIATKWIRQAKWRLSPM